MVYIHSETLADLDSNRVILASELRTKENKTISGLIGNALNLVLFEHIYQAFSQFWRRVDKLVTL